MRERIFRLGSSPWFLALVALVLRLAYFLYMAHLIPPQVLAAVPFQNEVGNVASSLAQGQGFCCLFRQPTGPTAWLSPVYPILVAAIFKSSGIFTLRSFYVAITLNCVFSAFATIPLFHAGKRIGGTRVAVLSSWVWAIFPSGIVLPFHWIWDTSLSALFAVTLLWMTLHRKESSRPRDFALYGFLWGMALLTNPALSAVLPFLLGWLLYQQRDNRALLLRLGTAALAALFLTCLPWTVRNFVQFHRFLPLRSNFPYEFWSGNNEIFDEHSREVNRITRFEQVRLYAQLGETEFLKEKMQNALHFVHTHPSLYARLFGERIVATWLGTGSPWRDFWATDSNFARFILVWNLFALAGVIVGLVRLYLQNRALFVPVAAFPLLFPFTFYIAHTTLRHRHPCDPILALLIAVAISGAHAPAQNSVEFPNSGKSGRPFF
jgi:4-amino-4-deoxy-L-arabinose transferase-like glycosyltransferase